MCALLVASMLLAGIAGHASSATAEVGAAPVVAAAGDIACDPSIGDFNGGLGTATTCRAMTTSELLLGGGLAAVLPLGDIQYACGGASAFAASYDQSWGRVRPITRPAPGNHEYQTSGGTDCDPGGRALGYYGYFGAAAGDPAKGYYSFDVGDWHLIALNSNCTKIGGCAAGSPQERWLRGDLASHGARCTLAYWHYPLFSSGRYRPGFASVQPLFKALYDYGADVVLSGHDHVYERFAPQDASGAPDPNRGLRQFTVGTGGRSHYEHGTPLANSEARDATTFGVLKLALQPSGYDWQFVPAAGGTFTDAGSEACEPSGDVTPPSPPQNLAVTAQSARSVTIAWSASTDDVGVVGYDVYRDGVWLTGTTGTTLADDTAAPSTTYEYRVSARDATGNRSALSAARVVTTGFEPTTSFAATADSRVEEATPGTNFGNLPLWVDGGAADPDSESYLRFQVAGLAGRVVGARLRIYAPTPTFDGPTIHSTASDWTESAITWSNRPLTSSTALDDEGAIVANTWVEYDVTSAVAGEGEYGFALKPTSSDGVDFHSRESSTHPPQLLVFQEGYPHPNGAAKARITLVPAVEPCTAATVDHAPPLVRGACTGVAPSSAHVTVPGDDTSRANGFMRLKVVCTDGAIPPCPASGDQADVLVTINANDVRQRPSLAEYLGELEGVIPLRATDGDNGPGGAYGGTVADQRLSFAVPCVPTSDPSLGASCVLDTSVDAVYPGAVKEGERAIWELRSVALNDGGPDGLAGTTAGNGPFMRPGLFVP